MTGDDQERFEDYLELERYIEDLQAGKAAHLPQNLTPELARIYRTAAQFCSASPGADEPSEQFMSDLEARLLDKFEEEQQEITEKRAVVVPRDETPQVVEEQVAEEAAGQPQELPLPYTEEPVQETPKITNKPVRRVRFFSRRTMLTGGAVAAASLAIGTGIGEKLGSAGNKSAATTTAAVNKNATSTPDESSEYGNTEYKQPWLVGNSSNSVPTTWHFVTTMAQLGNQAVMFAAGGVVGYVILKAKDADDVQASNEVIALSAACTHMGCIVQWQNSDRSFHCPCHNGLFTQNGLPDARSQMRYLAALPLLRVKVDGNGNIYVEVPKIE
jgi:Rieske Fe-S protein